MKILITGANGMLAKSVRTKLREKHDLICTDVADLDITNQETVIKYVEDLKPEYIVNCAAYTAVDKAEDNYDIADKINAEGPKNLAIAAKKIDIPVIHISTDYVFDGELDVSKSYVEDDKVGPVTVYGKTKLHGEQEVVGNTDKYYIFRTAWLYGDGNNFIRTMIKLSENHSELNVVDDQHGSPTYAEDLANIISEAIDKKIPYGIYHTTNQGFTTWYEFTKKIFEYAGIDCKVNPVSTEKYIEMMKVTQAKRPKNSQLSKEKILSQSIEVPTWEDALKRYLVSEGKM